MDWCFWRMVTRFSPVTGMASTALSMRLRKQFLSSRYSLSTWFFFFFQAEDGIRDLTVTGVQTCALPICDGDGAFAAVRHAHAAAANIEKRIPEPRSTMAGGRRTLHTVPASYLSRVLRFAEFRRGARQMVGRSGRSEEHTSELQSQSNLVC